MASGKEESETPAWHDDPRFWTTLGSWLIPRSAWRRAPVEVDGVVRLLGLKRDARVLDVACGPGRHSILLARRGNRVTGIDTCPEFLRRARRRAKMAGAEAEFMRADMRAFKRPGGFDAALLLDNCLGCFADPCEDALVLRNLRESMAPNGKVIVEVMSREIVECFLRKEAESGFTYMFSTASIRGGRLSYRRRVEEGGRSLVLDISGRKGGAEFDFVMRQRLYGASELVAALCEAGFSSVDLSGDLEGTPYKADGQSLVAIAGVPGECTAQ